MTFKNDFIRLFKQLNVPDDLESKIDSICKKLEGRKIPETNEGKFGAWFILARFFAYYYPTLMTDKNSAKNKNTVLKFLKETGLYRFLANLPQEETAPKPRNTRPKGTNH